MYFATKISSLSQIISSSSVSSVMCIPGDSNKAQSPRTKPQRLLGAFLQPITNSAQPKMLEKVTLPKCPGEQLGPAKSLGMAVEGCCT